MTKRDVRYAAHCSKQLSTDVIFGKHLVPLEQVLAQGLRAVVQNPEVVAKLTAPSVHTLWQTVIVTPPEGTLNGDIRVSIGWVNSSWHARLEYATENNLGNGIQPDDN